MRTAAVPRGELPAPLPSLRFVRGYLTTMRPYLLFLSGTVGLAGMALAPGVGTADTLLLGTAFFLSYGFGQALTDCFQLDTDRLSSPYRPLIRGEISRRHVLAVSVLGITAVSAVFVAYEPWNLALTMLAAVGLATYTRFKRLPWAGPWYNAAIVAVLLMIGHLAGLGAGGGRLRWTPALAGTVGVAFFGYANFVLVGYFKDVAADRRTGYRTLPVTRGFRRSARVSDVLALLELAAAAVAVWYLRPPVADRPAVSVGALVPVLILVAGVAAAVAGQLRAHAVEGEEGAHRAIVPVVDALLLLLLGIAGLGRPDWSLWLVGYFVLYRLALRRRPARQQI